MSSIYYIFVINRAGSLIFDWENKDDDPIRIEKTFAYPLDIQIEPVDSKPTVVFGERDGIRVKHVVSAINGLPIAGLKFTSPEGEELGFMEYIADEKNYPLNLTFTQPTLTANDKIIIASTFHSLYEIAAQLSPAVSSSGIKLLETTQFKLHCFQAITSIKFVVVTSVTSNVNIEAFLRKLYELYADFALKNPFYTMDMPIRCDKFDDGLRQLLDKPEKSYIVSL